jgi:ketosteroid isomerase-like protein
VIAIAAPRARAEPADGKAVVAALVRAINAHDPRAVAALFRDGIAIFPAAADEGIGTAAVEAAAKRWLTALGNATVKLEQPHYSSDCFDGDLVVSTGAHLRITGVIHGDYEVKKQVYDDRDKTLHLLGALHISEPADDKAVLAAAAAGTLPSLPALGTGDFASETSLRPDKIADYANRVADDPAVVLIGSAASERASGPAAIAKLLKRWRSLKLTTTALKTGPLSTDSELLAYAVAHAEATFKVNGKTVKVPYRVLIAVFEPWAVAAEHGEKPHLISAHFSVATH